MIKIDQNDTLYKFLKGIGADDVEADYLELASNGRYSISDIRKYLKSKFDPSLTKELDDKELEKILDYYIDIKKIKRINKKELKNLLEMYYDTQDDAIKNIIITSCLKDVLCLCLNYSTMHTNIDIQDLIQVANIGIITALNKYQPKSKIDFNDYILYWTRKEIIKEFEEKN